MNQEALPEVAPTVVCDVGLGKILNNLEVDVSHFTELMRSESISDSDIETTTLHISADSVISDDEGGLSNVRVGEYTRETRTVKVNVGSYVDVIKYEKSNPNPGKVPDDDSVDLRISLKISEIARHETSHRIDDINMGLEGSINEDFTYLRQVASRSHFKRIIRKAMALTRIPELQLKARIQEVNELLEAKESHDIYRNSPAEARARQKAERLAPDGDYPIRLILKR